MVQEQGNASTLGLFNSRTKFGERTITIKLHLCSPHETEEISLSNNINNNIHNNNNNKWSAEQPTK